MKLPKNSFLFITSQREGIIQKQIQNLQKEILDWVAEEDNSTGGQKEIILRVNPDANFFYHSVLNLKETKVTSSRLKFISLTSARLEKLYEVKPTRTTFQKQNLLIEKVIVYLDTLLLISKRMLLISKSETMDKSNQKDLQLEVGTLIDEIDRIASFAEFNRMSLLMGDFSKNSRVASMWFINEKSGKLFRMYIATMTAKSLGLITLSGYPLALSNSTLFQKKIENTILRINEERNRIRSVLD
ncbi:flagellar filament core protein flaB2 domain protein [Leptospira perdikensis]|uniref:Flagellar filament core protein flaB2 domain protein n=1 Tax=Leptospira perdikensis TaxID=2484948 RepID=A0A4R9JIB4_9LEPT|nr:flagellar filament core protein flaB2 domain protein [Leptospira perdikensis]